jgi:hypothetical protein
MRVVSLLLPRSALDKERVRELPTPVPEAGRMLRSEEPRRNRTMIPKPGWII